MSTALYSMVVHLSGALMVLGKFSALFSTTMTLFSAPFGGLFLSVIAVRIGH